MAAILTIYIPTFNRPAQLLRTLEGLLPQLTDAVELVISDNCSERPVESLLTADILKRTRIIRRRYNVSGNENILRGFEDAQTSWMWTLSDDDRISATAVADILRTIAQHADYSDIAILKFSDDHNVIPSFTMSSLDQLPSCIGNLIFMSTSVYRVESCLEAATIAHQYTYSMAPVLMTMLAVIMKKKKVVFIELVIANWVRPLKANEWSFLAFSNAILTIFEYPFPEKVRADLYRKIKTMPYSLLRVVYIDLQHSFNDAPEARDVRFLVKCIYAKRSVLGPTSERLGIAVIKIFTCNSLLNALFFKCLKTVVRDNHSVQYDRTSRW